MKPFDISRFRKSITKSLDGISVGFHDPDTWISTGSYALNKAISGDFNRGIPLGKVSVFAGESGSGKSFVVSGNIVANAQKQGIFVILIDTENALDTDWLEALGVDTSEDKLLKINAAMIDDVAKIISDFMKSYKSDYASVPKEERMKVLFVIDSIGMLMTPTDVAQFEGGDMKGDMGRKAKALKALVTNCVNMIGEWNVGIIATNHTYASQDMFDKTDKIGGGSGPIFAASIVALMNKFKLKVDEDGNKVTDVLGIRSKFQVAKSRYAKPFESVEIHIPYETGMDPYSGLVDMFEKAGLLVKDGNKLKYVAVNGTETKLFRKEWKGKHLDAIMLDYPEHEKRWAEERAKAGLPEETLPEHDEDGVIIE